jgi:site-specific recombinase XerD
MTDFNDGTFVPDWRNRDRKFTATRRLRRRLTPDEEQRLWNACPADGSQEHLLLALMLTIGLRPREVRYLPRNAVHSNVLHVRGKDGQQRTIHLNDEAARVLRCYLESHLPTGDDHEPLLHLSDGRPLDIARLSEFVHALGVRAGLDWQLSVHDLRHAALLRAAAALRKFEK